MMTVATWWVGLMIASAGPGPVSVPEPLRPVAEKMRHVRTLQAAVQQKKELGAFSEVMENQGYLAFARPRRLVMDFSGPGGTRLVVHGDTMTVHYKALGRTETTLLSKDPRARAVAEHLFLLLQADPQALAKLYKLEIRSEKPLQVRLRPLAQALAAIIDSVDVVFGDDGLVRQMRLREQNGDSTSWLFTNPVLNEQIPADRFAPSPQNTAGEGGEP